MIVIPGPASNVLGERIASRLGVGVYPAEHRIFPDGESYIRLSAPIRGETAVIVQTTSPPQDTHLIQLFMMTSTAVELGAKRVVCVVPYLAYSRQDKRFLKGEALSLELILHLLKQAGADDVMVLDAHNASSLQRAQRKLRIRVENLSAIPLLAEKLKAEGWEGGFSLSPDEGGVHLAEMGGEILGGGVGFFEKKRDRRTGELRMEVKDLDLESNDVVVFDDIISSGKTMALAVESVNKFGARKVAVACTHALFMGDAENRIRQSGADLILTTDAVETKFSKVSVSSLIAQHILDMAI